MNYLHLRSSSYYRLVFYERVSQKTSVPDYKIPQYRFLFLLLKTVKENRQNQGNGAFLRAVNSDYASTVSK